MRHLLSKIVAGGLSAGVILLWWPLVFPSDTVESWLVRGVLWTLCFELMLHAFAPVEESLWGTTAARRVADQAKAASARLGPGSPRKRYTGRGVVAAVALLVPLTLLASAPSHPVGPKPAGAQVRQVTEVKRIVRVERRSVAVPSAAVPAARTTAAPDEAAVAAAAAPRSSAGTGAAQPRRPAGPRRAAQRRNTGGTTRRPPSPTAAPTVQQDTATTSPAAPSAGSDEPSATAQRRLGAFDLAYVSERRPPLTFRSPRARPGVAGRL